MKKFFLALALAFLVSSAQAEPITLGGVAPAETLAKQAVVVEAATGAVLYAKDSETKMPTSSMSKVLTMYLVFDAIKKGRLALDSTLTVSENAWKQQGSRSFLAIGQQVKVEDLVRGVIVQSGNDASVVLAEAVGGSEGGFAGMMNEKARELGLTNSHFVNATGLPDDAHYSTARDLAVMALALLRDFPEFYHYYSEKEFTFNGIKQGNRNPLLYRNIGVDGIKTGHTEAAGYGLIASALRDGRRVITVLNGMNSMQARADESAKLLDWAYREYGLYQLVKAGEKISDAKVWLGKKKTVEVAGDKDLYLSLPRLQRDQVKLSLSLNAETQAPIQKGQGMGKLVVTAPGYDPAEVSAVAMEDVERLGFFARMIAKLKRLVGKE